MRGPGTAKTKQVWCTHCGGSNDVAVRAMSVFCAHCHKRLILEDLVIKTYQALKDYATCGDVTVEKRGRVVASIRSKKLTVKGTVEGSVRARGPVEVASSGSIAGDVTAASLVIRQGASVRGFCEIRPLPPEQPTVPALTAEEAPAQTAAPAVAPVAAHNPKRNATGNSTALPSERDAPAAGRVVKAIVTTRRKTTASTTKTR